MSEALYLLGCGGHGRVVLDAALASGLVVTGILDPGLAPGTMVFGVPVCGGDEFLASPPARGAQLLNGVGANPNLKRRRALFDGLGGRHEFPRVQHPSALAARLEELGAGVQLMAGAIVQPGTAFGANCVVNTGASVDHDCHIGAHCFVSPRAVLCGGVTLGEGVFIGAAAVLLPGVSVGAGAVIGAGSVVHRDVAAHAVVVGNPARKLRLNT